MIPLNTTWDTVLMLLISGGVGLIGGIAAGLLEMRRPDTPGIKTTCSRKKFIGSVFLGGVAAVAILYFFPPEEAVKSGATVVNQYNLTRLVAFALIIGSAGTNFLLSMQARTRAAVATQLAETKQETATQAIGGVGAQVSVATEMGLKTATPILHAALQRAREGKKGKKVSASFVEEVVDDLSKETVKAVEEQMDPLVDAAQETVRAAGPSLEPNRL